MSCGDAKAQGDSQYWESSWESFANPGVQLVYVVRSLMPPMEVFHGLPGTAYSFKQPGEHKEWGEIEEAKAALEAR